MVGDEPDAVAGHPSEADHDVLGVARHQFEEVGFIDDLDDQFLDVVRAVGIIGDERIERQFEAVGGVVGRHERRLFLVGRRQEAEEAAGHHRGFDVVLEGEVGDARLARVRDRAAEFLGGHFFMGHGLAHFRTGHEHIGRIFNHEDEIGHRGRVDRAAGAGTHDEGDLRDHARGENVALEDVGIPAERGDAFLNPRRRRSR